MSGEYQLIPARHGTATFVPRGHTIMIRNTYGKQVVDTWAFALNSPPKRKKGMGQSKSSLLDDANTGTEKPERKDEEVQSQKSKFEEELYAQARAQKNEGNEDKKEAEDTGKPPAKNTWSSYIPSFRSVAGPKGTKKKDDEDEEVKKKNTRAWASYLPSGEAFTSYLPSTETLSAFAASHHRDPSKSIAEQLYDFSKTPVGAAGLSAATGSGTAGSLYAAYSAYAAQNYQDDPPMEFMNMARTRAKTTHLVPKVGDTLVSNLGLPIMTLIEDTTPGIHDTLIAACNPQRYKDLGVEKWEEHGSCSENLVLALKELNEKAGFKGSRAIGADVTVNTVPDPLNIFMNVSWDNDGGLEFQQPPGKRNQYVKFRADRDLVVVMSACPMDVTPVNGGKCMVAHFMVEVPKEDKAQRVEPTRQISSGKATPKLTRLRSSQGPRPAQSPRRVSEQTSVQLQEKKKPKKLEIRSSPRPT